MIPAFCHCQQLSYALCRNDSNSDFFFPFLFVYSFSFRYTLYLMGKSIESTNHKIPLKTFEFGDCSMLMHHAPCNLRAVRSTFIRNVHSHRNPKNHKQLNCAAECTLPKRRRTVVLGFGIANMRTPPIPWPVPSPLLTSSTNTKMTYKTPKML